MKKRFIGFTSFMLSVTLLASAAPYAARGASIYEKTWRNVSAPAAVEEEKGIKYTPIPEMGIPLELTGTHDPITKVYVYANKGSAKFECDFKTPGVYLTVESDTAQLKASAREKYIYLENNGLEAGAAATLTVTATHADFEPVVQQVKVSITDGSLAYPHIVADKEDLININAVGLNKSYRQSADIDLIDVSEWKAIGNERTPFTGTYNGGGFKITNMSFRETDSGYAGLFGAVFGKDAKISGIKLEGRLEKLLYQASAHGTVVGTLEYGTVSDCSFKGDITLDSSESAVGGIVGSVINGGIIENCSFDGKIKTKSNDYTYIGGIAGVLYGSAENCQAGGDISVEGKKVNVGGIVGLNNGVIRGSVATAGLGKYGSVSADSNAGIVVSTNDSIRVQSALGDSANGSLGGIAGINASEIYGSAYIGKLYTKGDRNKLGGIAGVNSGNIVDCAVKGDIGFSGSKTYSGGIAGNNRIGDIVNSTAAVDISGDGFESWVGGIAGENYSFIDHTDEFSKDVLALIERCSFNGNIVLKGSGSFVGGIAGRNCGVTSVAVKTGVRAGSTISKCVMTGGSIEGANAGRIVAENALETLGFINSASQKHFITLSDNAALDDVLINGSAVGGNPTADSLNGASLTAEDINGTLISYEINPEAMRYIK